MSALQRNLAPIAFDDLAKHSAWPKRLLGLETFGVRHKSELEVLREFQEERWGALLERARTLKHPTLAEVERIYGDPVAIAPCYVDGSFYLTSQKEMLDAHLDLYAEVLAPYVEGASCLVELGAGYGSKLFGLSSREVFSNIPLVAGEFTENGCAMISLLATHLSKPVSVGHCDFRTLTMKDVGILEGAVIFTSYAAHYVPEMPVEFVRFLARFKPRVVVHFEPCYEHFDEQSLHGLMCRRYMELNDYTRNLATVIETGRRQEGITVRVRKNVLGSNPFLPPLHHRMVTGSTMTGLSKVAATVRLPKHLERLQAESIEIMREVVAELKKPVMLYSIKNSSVMLHLAVKAFYPAPLPFPLLHVDTTWKFREMIAFRDATARRLNANLVVHVNREGLAAGINPFSSGSSVHTNVMKTEGLKQALDKYGFDAALGGARRDEEKSRAKERIFSFRSKGHVWDPRNQRPELWNLFNTRIRPGKSIRVFPLSNWTELDVWQYIRYENIPIVPLYLAKQRPVVRRNGNLIMVDDDRIPLEPGEKPELRRVRFRTLGCYPLTGAINSDAETIEDVVSEIENARFSERQGRLIDSDEAASMEQKKREGYF